jgi:ribosomal protein L1
MKKISPKYKEAAKKVEATKLYNVAEAIALAKSAAYAKFDETVDLAFRLGIDPRHADQMVRGAIVMPAGTGKKTTIVVITAGEKLSEAEKAIDEMMTREELKGNQSKLDMNKNGKLDSDDFKKLRGEKKGMEESKLSISTSIKNMDRLINNLTEGLKKKV